MKSFTPLVIKVKEKVDEFVESKKGESGITAMMAIALGGMIAFIVTAILLYLLPTILYSVTNSTAPLAGAWGTSQTNVATAIQGAIGVMTILLIIEAVVTVIAIIMVLKQHS
jgi:uncharacterized protein YqhQ